MRCGEKERVTDMVMMASTAVPNAEHRALFSLRGRFLAAAALSAVLFGGIGVWAATARLDSVVIGSGSVLVRSDMQSVQHLEGGTLAALLVARGDSVEAGQPVLRLDTFEIDSRIAMFEAQLMEAEARAARFAAERDGEAMADPVVTGGAFDLANADWQRIVAGERRLMDETRTARETQVQALALQAEQLRFDSEGMSMRRAALVEELVLVEEAHARFEKLLQGGSVEKTRLDEILRDMTRMRGEMGQIDANLARNETRQREITLERNRLSAKAEAEAHRELRVLEPQITDLRQQLAAYRERRDRMELRAPVSGVVNEVNVATLGEVVPPGKTLVSIVPTAEDMVIEFRIAVTDIDAIEPGQAARLRFSAFNQRVTPEIDAVVETISAAAVTDPATGMAHYTARARPVGDLAELGTRGLVPGMPVEVFVPTAERVAISYIVQPVVDQMQRAMREE
jgi:HlyD family secretion protein